MARTIRACLIGGMGAGPQHRSHRTGSGLTSNVPRSGLLIQMSSLTAGEAQLDIDKIEFVRYAGKYWSDNLIT